MNSIKSNKISGVSNNSNKFVNGTKKAFENIKKFTKSKPFRLIIALIVIGTIITGITFAIIYLMKAIKKNCTNQPGTKWSDSLKMCIPECTNYKNGVCNVPGKELSARCVPDNYCDFTDLDGNQYKYDPNTCECTIDCSDPEQPFRINGDNTISGHNMTEMTSDGKGGYIPKNQLICGIACPESTDGWCPSDSYCGTSESDNGYKTPGCLPKSSYEFCSKINGVDNYCKNKTCIKTGRNAGYCDSSMLCGHDGYTKPLVVACTNDKGCNSDGTSNNKCMKGKLITEHYKSDPELYKFKFYEKVGFCDKMTNEAAIGSNCIDKKNLGETNTGDIFDCNKKSRDTIGVSGYLNQCDDTTYKNTGYACAKNGLCNNEWQAKPEPGSSKLQGCITGSDAENPDDYALTLCCDKKNIVNNVGPIKGKFCCPIKPTDKTGTCTLDTEYPYLASDLEAPGDTNGFIPCSIDEDCTIYNDKLWHKLGNTGSNPEKEILKSQSLEERAKYAEMYCASSKEHSGKKYCKAACGLFDDITFSSGPESPTYGIFNNHYGVMNDTRIDKHGNKTKSNSVCFNNNTEYCKLRPEVPFKGPLINEAIPVCTINGLPDKNAAWAGGGTYATLAGKEGKGYLGKGSYQLYDPKHDDTVCSKEMTRNSCLNVVAKNLSGIHDFESNGNTGECNFKFACDQYKIGISKNYRKNQKNATANWADLLNSKAPGGPHINRFNNKFWNRDYILEPPNSSSNSAGIKSRYNIPYCKGDRKNNQIPDYAYYNPTYPLSEKDCKGTKCYDIPDSQYGCALKQNQETIKLSENGSYCKNGINILTGNCK